MTLSTLELRTKSSPSFLLIFRQILNPFGVKALCKAKGATRIQERQLAFFTRVKKFLVMVS